ncbi:MAG: MATE family efflux transporter, partial [Clostridia bacterium]|nr:MATE family efflux transporter [Clostridia bacterium]
MAKIKMDMTQGKILPQLMKFSLPIIATSIIHQLFNTADTIVVGRWGGATPEAREIAISAVGACGALSSLLITFFMGLSVGAGVVVSHAVGAKQYEKIQKTVHTSILTATICGFLLAFVGFVFADPLLRFMDTPDSIMEQSILYMRAYFCGIPAQLIYNYGAAMLRSTGDSTRPLIFLSTAGVVNVVLNLVMVLGFEQGALGVGVATAASQWVSCLMLLVYLMRSDGYCRFSWRKLKFHLPTLKSVLAIGIPSGIQSSMFAIGNAVMQTALNSFNSSVYVSGSSISSNVGTYTQLICGGFVQAIQVFVGQNTGAKKMERIRQGVKVSLLVTVLSSIVLNAILNLVSGPILELFAPGNTEVIEFAKIKLLVNSSCYFLAHWGDLYAVSLRGMGKSTVPMI